MIKLLLVTFCGALLILGGATAYAYSAADSLIAPQQSWPVPGVITQPFGCTTLQQEPMDLSCPDQHFHSGVDIAAPMGTPVHAVLGGVAHVIAVLWGYGFHVIVDSNGGLSTVYGHLSSVAVSDGDLVLSGQLIGAVGTSGNSTGPHLHFELRVDGQTEDPLSYLHLSPTNQPNT